MCYVAHMLIVAAIQVALTAAIIYLLRKVYRMSTSLDALAAQVAINTSAEASAVALIQGLAAQLAAIANDPAAVAALAAQLKTSADALSAAIVANTPAAPTP